MRISGANPRPRDPAAADDSHENRLVLVEPEVMEPEPVILGPSRLAATDGRNGRIPRRLLPRDDVENDRTMNPLERPELQPHKNGQASPAALRDRDCVTEERPAPGGWSSAFHAAQENLAALQRLAEQTADLHRQFLEGQEKTQQTFLKLLEQQQRLAVDLRVPAGAELR